MRQGNLLGEHSHKVQRIMGMLHRSPRPLLWSTGGHPERLKVYEGKVTLPYDWKINFSIHSPT